MGETWITFTTHDGIQYVIRTSQIAHMESSGTAHYIKFSPNRLVSSATELISAKLTNDEYERVMGVLVGEK